MQRTIHLIAAVLTATTAIACSNPTPSPTASARTASPTAQVTAAPSPTIVAAAPTPPYTIVSGVPEQQPGTIIFGPMEANSISPFVGYPLSFSIDQPLAFGGYFGRAVGAPSVDVELFKQDGEQWPSEWLHVTNVDPAATGLLATLPTFDEPGTYRLDIRADGQVIATSLISVAPACTGVCTGG